MASLSVSGSDNGISLILEGLPNGWQMLSRKVYVMLMITPYPYLKPIVGIFGHPEHLLKLISNCVTTSLELDLNDPGIA